MPYRFDFNFQNNHFATPEPVLSILNIPYPNNFTPKIPYSGKFLPTDNPYPVEPYPN